MPPCLSAAWACASRARNKNNVEEYCVSEGWVRLSVGNTRDRKGRPLTVKLKGPVEPYFRAPVGDA